MGINIQRYGGSHQELLPKLSALNLQSKSLKRPIIEHIFGNVLGLIKLKFFLFSKMWMIIVDNLYFKTIFYDCFLMQYFILSH